MHRPASTQINDDDDDDDDTDSDRDILWSIKYLTEVFVTILCAKILIYFNHNN